MPDDVDGDNEPAVPGVTMTGEMVILAIVVAVAAAVDGFNIYDAVGDIGGHGQGT